jgi:hypothetical protein
MSRIPNTAFKSEKDWGQGIEGRH